MIRQYVSPDGVPRQEVTMEGSPQEMVHVEEGDSFSKVVKRTVVRSEGDQTEVTDSFSYQTTVMTGCRPALRIDHLLTRVMNTTVYW